jgi:hypothetical protein
MKATRGKQCASYKKITIQMITNFLSESKKINGVGEFKNI